MSRILNASQYEKAYLPHKLGNFEVPDAGKLKPSAATSPKHKTADGRTQPIVDSRGYLLVPKRPAAFNLRPPVYSLAPARWPQPNPTIKGTAAATMGYKGIQTDYLPISTVTTKTVMLPGCKETTYN